MTVLIDDRKGSKELQKYISSPSKLVRMGYGDFAFQGNGPNGTVGIGIERKSIPDLISSIVSGRLTGHQLIGLVNSYDYVSIVADGPIKTNKDGHVLIPKGKNKWVPVMLKDKPLSRSFLDNYLYSLFITTDIWSHFTPSAKQTGLWIDSQYDWWQKKWTEHKAHLGFYVPKPPRPMFLKPSLVHRMIKEIDKVGWEKGLSISKNFRCMADIVLSDVNDLQKVPGVGKVLAQRILNSLWGEK
jgi:ERCC4-type nuclease